MASKSQAKVSGSRTNRPRGPASGRLSLLIGTAKGGFLLRDKGGRAGWRMVGPFHLGARTHDMRLDPRDGRTLLASSTGGHLGPTIYRSTDAGKTWTEAARSPRFDRVTPKSPRGKRARASRGYAVRTNFWLEPGHADEEGVWYCGTSPQGLFRSTDGGDTWRGVKGWNHNPMWTRWVNAPEDGTPDGPVLHSIQIDSRDARHMTISCSSGGTFETWNRGKDWEPRNSGVAADFLPSADVAFGHDPHCMVMHPADPDRWYQQNHCGIYALDRSAGTDWERIGRRMPKRVGDIGFPLVAHPTDPDTVWVFPMDGSTLWPRTAPAGSPAVFRTRDGGRRWERQDLGLPRKQAYLTVLRQAMTVDLDPKDTGIYFGTTSGEVWASTDSGASWGQIAAHLPRIYSVRAAHFRR